MTKPRRQSDAGLDRGLVVGRALVEATRNSSQIGSIAWIGSLSCPNYGRRGIVTRFLAQRMLSHIKPLAPATFPAFSLTSPAIRLLDSFGSLIPSRRQQPSTPRSKR
jgi:hypothetical protein